MFSKDDFICILNHCLKTLFYFLFVHFHTVRFISSFPIYIKSEKSINFKVEAWINGKLMNLK